MCNGCPDHLNDLYNDYREKNTDPGNIRVAALMAVDNGDLSEACASKCRSHSGIAEDSDYHKRNFLFYLMLLLLHCQDWHKE